MIMGIWGAARRQLDSLERSFDLALVWLAAQNIKGFPASNLLEEASHFVFDNQKVERSRSQKEVLRECQWGSGMSITRM